MKKTALAGNSSQVSDGVPFGGHVNKRLGLDRKGNWCGHDPNSPRFFLQPDSHKPRPKILVWAGEAWSRFYNLPGSYFQEIRSHRVSKRRQRSEAREALASIAQALLHYAELASLRVGVPHETEGFKSLPIEFLAKKAGLGLKRAERAIGLLKRAGYIKLIERFDIKDERFIGLAAVKSLTPAFFKACGINLQALSAQRRLARKRLNKKRSKVFSDANEQSSRLSFKVLDFVLPRGNSKAHVDSMYAILKSDNKKVIKKRDNALLRRESLERSSE